MGLLDRFRKDPRPALDGEGGASGDDDEVAPPIPLDVAARRLQLVDLDDALRRLARELAADTVHMANPGWAGMVSDYRAVAAEAARLERDGFDRADLTDLAAQVVPLWPPRLPEPPQEYRPYADSYRRVEEIVAALRETLPGEQR
jgi:hypothetical protein